MSQAVRQFLRLLNGKKRDEIITEAWEELSIFDRAEAEELSEAPETMEMEVPQFVNAR